MFGTTNISKRKTTDDGFHMKFKNGTRTTIGLSLTGMPRQLKGGKHLKRWQNLLK